MAVVTREVVVEQLNIINREYEFNYGDIKTEQIEVITSILQNKDVVAVLPTGFGKTFCFTAPSLILDKLKPEVRHVTIVISPLLALMKDHVTWLRDHGIQANMITSEMTKKDKDDIKEGRASIIFTSPEALIAGMWRGIIPKVYAERVCLVTYDEAHCISEWGLDFRPDYKKVAEVQNMLSSPTLALTATATRDILIDIKKELCLSRCDIISSLPNRPNIFLERCIIKENVQELQWLVNELKDKGNRSKKTLIYVNYVLSTADIYDFLKDGLGDDLFVDNIQSSEHRLVDMFSSGTHTTDKGSILKRFKDAGGNLRVAIATVAFGMGIDIPDVDIVIHWGLPRTALQYWQQAGRAGRDNRDALSLLYIFPRSVSASKDEDMKSFAAGPDSTCSSTCMRYVMLKLFCVTDVVESELQKLKSVSRCTASCQDQPCKCASCKCCTVCAQSCPCSMDFSSRRNHYLSM